MTEDRTNWFAAAEMPVIIMGKTDAADRCVCVWGGETTAEALTGF